MARPKARVRIQDLSKDVKVSEEEMKRVAGGGVSLRTGYCVSNPMLKGELTGFCVQNPLLERGDIWYK